MSKKPTNPLLRLFERLSAQQGQNALRTLSMTGSECRACHTPHFFAGPLIGMPIIEKIYIPVRILVHELPDGPSANSWNHCGMIHSEISRQANAPLWLWQSACPDCGMNGIGDEVRRSFMEIREKGRAPVDLSKCFRCGDVCGRHVGATIKGGFQLDTKQGFRPVAGIELFELDDRSDYNIKPRPDGPERWRFIGTFDISKGENAVGEYIWRAQCPKCVRIDMPRMSVIPTLGGMTGRA